MSSPKKIVVGKSFRLIDFHIYDESSKTNSSDEDNSSIDSNIKRERPESHFVIQMFGVAENGETACIYVNDYQPFFYIRVGDDWTHQTVQELFRDIRKRVGKYMESSVLSAELVHHHKLYGFSGGKQHSFAKFTFKNLNTMNRTRNLWYSYQEGGIRTSRPLIFRGVTLELYESTIPPLLRYFHINNISPSGWVFVPVPKAQTQVRTTTCTYEYTVSKRQLRPLPQKETRVPYKICSFDIEASSSHGDFPLPKKSYKRLATQLVDAFIRQQGAGPLDTTRAKGLLKRVVMTAFGHDHFDDVDVVYPKTVPTKERLLQLLELLNKTPVKNAKAMNEEEDNSDVLAIDTIFERIKEAANAGADDDDDAGESNQEVDVVPSWMRGSTKRTPKVEKTATLYDILSSTKYERDEKIQLADQTITLIGFPRLEGDQVTFIGSTFMRYGEPEPYMNHCLVLGTCDPVEGAVIQTADTETDLLLQWTELIQRENPDIIIGYNIFGFDYEFMFRRAEETHCEYDFLKLSRKRGELCAKRERPTGFEDDEDLTEKSPLQIENTKIVLATGEYDLRFFKMTGRLQIDMYTYFRRDFNLSSYKLDDVAGQYISDDIKRIEYAQHPLHGPVTELFSGNLTGLHQDDYIHIEISGFTSDYYQEGRKFRVLAIDRGRSVQEVVKGKECTNIYNVIVISGHEPIQETAAKKHIKWGVAKDDVTPQDIFRLSRGSSADRAVVAKYCIQDCNLVHHLMNKIDVITGYVEMSRICSVPISFLVFRGQGIKLTSYVAKKCREKNTLMPDLEKTGVAEGYEGAIVLPPKCAMYMDNPVACVDYSSLYPSSMISQNYSHDSKVWTREYDLAGNLTKETGEKDTAGNYVYDNLPGYQYINIEFDTYKYLAKSATAKAEKTKVGRMICRWAQLPNNQKSIMPSILEELLKARKDTRNMIKTEKDPFMQNILDKRQLGYKVTANSLYGQCGARTSTFYEKDVAACTTATGRQMITYAKRIVEEVYGDLEYVTEGHGPVRCRAEYVYGDTDSVFFTFNLENPETGEKIRGKPALEMTIEIAQDAAKLCTQFLKPPMELSYEKTLMPFILLSKKRYVGVLYEEDPNKGKLKYMGLSLKRRDSCDYLKDTYGSILNILMRSYDQNGGKNTSIQDAISYLDKSLENLIAGNVPMEKLMLTKALRGDYKNPQQIAHRVLAERIGKRDPGNKPKPGDRMRFVFVANQGKKPALLGDRIETPEFIEANSLKVDYIYYITNQLMKPLQQLFGLALEQIWEHQRKPGAIKTYRKEIAALEKEVPDLEVFMKKREKLSSAKIKTLLFDKFLHRIENEQRGVQAISAFFATSKKLHQ